MPPETESNPTASAPLKPSQADVLAENEALKARLSALEDKVAAGTGPSTGPSTELSAALERATKAEARVVALEKELVQLEASVVQRAGKMAARIVCEAGITGRKNFDTGEAATPGNTPKAEPNLTEQIRAANAAKRAA